jgi:hypothetical protein
MKKSSFIFVVTFFLITLICSLSTQAGEINTHTDNDIGLAGWHPSEEIYIYTNEKGILTITNLPISDKFLKKAKKIESFQRDSPEAIQRYQAEQEAKEQRHEAESRQRQQINEANRQQQPSQRSRSNIQDMRNREADKLEAAAKQHIPGSRGMTAAQRNELDNAARIRAGEETVPYTPPPPPPSSNVAEPKDYYRSADGQVRDSKTGVVLRKSGNSYINPATGELYP